MMKQMNRREYLTCLGLVTIIVTTIWVGFAVSLARAETLKAKVTNYSVKLEYVPAGDVEGHVIGLNTRVGKAVFEDSQVADYLMASTFDFTLGKGGITNGYTKMTFRDNSFIMFKWRADAGIGPNRLPTSKGTGTITGGGGRFKGIKGMVSFSGKRTKPTSEDPKREMVVDAVLNYRLD
jgi:hypothetical protein